MEQGEEVDSVDLPCDPATSSATEYADAEERALLNNLASFASNAELEQKVVDEFLSEEVASTSRDEPAKFDALIGVSDEIRRGERTYLETKEEGELESSSSSSEYVCSDADFVPSEEECVDHLKRPILDALPNNELPGKKKVHVKLKASKKQRVETVKDDANDPTFEERIRSFNALREYNALNGESHPTGVKNFKNEYSLSEEVWRKLYRYQKTGVRWLCELNEQGIGGILADEMGLGKTIQVIAFLRSLAESQKQDDLLGITGLGPSLIICPTTVMHQWVKEIHRWMPLCRVAVLHSSGSFKGSKARLIAKFATSRRDGSILISSYSTFTNEKKLLLNKDWHYVILDEGHKIRNPDAMVTLALKEVHTPYRLILSGSPMQNSLKELWSLIDFVYPGRLGTLKTFTEKFAVPITQGGYANATEVQSLTAYKCALVLRDAINPIILRRMKKDVQHAIELPTKNEQVLFCELTDDQRRLYKEYLSSRECARILKGSMDAFVGLIALRKLCNHPDLITGGPNKHGEFEIEEDPSKEYGWFERSGKMVVVKSLLRLWKQGANKVLLFSQSRQMCDILERMLLVENYDYLRMDGSTSIGSRQALVDKFNDDSQLFVFLLTTRVGGLGINLCGANKVIIFDPDWNPSTDAQARERAWRIGQQRAVTIYRLMCTGTIEEKIYHRQIFKQFLTNRILRDPKQRRFFKSNELHELFTFTESKSDDLTETGHLFAGETSEIRRENFFDLHEKERESKRKSRKAVEKSEENDEEEDDADGNVVAEKLSDERRERLREAAKLFSKNMESQTWQSIPLATASKENSKKRKRRKKELFDGEHVVPYLKKQRRAKEVKPDEEDEKKAKQRSDDYVLARLLETTGVRSALQHDDLVGESSSRILIEKEAESVAKQAAKAVRSTPVKSFLQKLRGDKKASSTSTSSLLNSSRRSGDDDERLFNGKRSKGTLLDFIDRTRAQQLEGDSAGDSASGKYVRMAEELKIWLRKHSAEAHTNEIVDAFKEKITSYDQSQFRAILKQLCDFEPARKLWRLRAEFV